MKELNRVDRLTIATALVALVIVIGLLTVRKPELTYSYSIEETLKTLVSEEYLVNPDELARSVENGTIFLVDLRSPVEFRKASIPGSYNMPVQDILNPDNIKTFQKLKGESKTIILYGNQPGEANSGRILLYQVGIPGGKILSCGFNEYWKNLNAGTAATENLKNPEYPVVNFNEFMKKTSTIPESSEKTNNPEPVKLIKREKKTAAEGGC